MFRCQLNCIDELSLRTKLASVLFVVELSNCNEGGFAGTYCVQVELSCRDGGLPPLTSTRQITVRVVDDNDNTPQLQSEVFTVDVHENNHVGDVVLVVNASDLDDGRNAALTFHLEPLDSPQTYSDVVTIDLHSGVITALTT